MVLTRSRTKMLSNSRKTSNFQYNEERGSIIQEYPRIKANKKISKNHETSKRRVKEIESAIRKKMPKFILKKAKSHAWVRNLIGDVVDRLSKLYENHEEKKSDNQEEIISINESQENYEVSKNLPFKMIKTKSPLGNSMKLEAQDFFIFEPSLELQATTNCKTNNNVFLKYFRNFKRIVTSHKFFRRNSHQNDSTYMNQYFSLYEVSALLYEYSKSLKKKTFIDFERVKIKYSLDSRSIFEIADKLNNCIKKMGASDIEDFLKVVHARPLSSKVIFTSDIPINFLNHVHKDRDKVIVDIVQRPPPVINLCEENELRNPIDFFDRGFIINNLNDNLSDFFNLKME